MGIQNLLRFIKPFMKPIHIKKYSGKRIGIDAYSWLHKGAYSCSMELCLGLRSDAAKRYLKYFMHHINLLRHYGITPVVVFDGGNIPCKATTEHERHRRREANLELAKEKLRQGNVSVAIEFFQKAVQITPTMAHELIQILRSQNVEFVVAPYEADAQLAYLSTLDVDKGGVAAVITEDSDLIAYGCEAVIFKMDRYGNGEELVLDKVFNSVSDGLCFRNFSKELFTGMCVLAGCDFLPSIAGIGTKRAYSLVSKYRNLDRVLSSLKVDKHYRIPEDYPESFRKAVAVFRHARIYDAETKELKHMKPLDHRQLQSLNGETDFLGPDLPPSIAAAIAEGHLNPSTMEAFGHFSKANHRSDPIDISGFNCFGEDESCVTQSSCITIFPSKYQRSEEISFKNDSQMSAQESCITVFPGEQFSNEEITVTRQKALDQKKYMKEALALGRLIAPVECNQEVKHDLKKIEIPNNNPFKRRKVEIDNKKEDSFAEQMSISPDFEKSLDDLCSSSPVSLETVESKPTIRATAATEKNPKKNKTKHDSKTLKGDENSILKFFQRM